MDNIYGTRSHKIRNLIKNYKKSSSKIFFVEGIKEFEMAIRGNYFPMEIFICKKIFHKYNLIKSFNHIVFFISIKAFKKLAYRENSGGIIALFKRKNFERLENIKIHKNPFILILDGIEKPGNLGAMLRIADAVGIHFIILCNIKTYIYNPNIIRCSLGSVFTNKILIEETDYITYWLQKQKIEIVVTGFHETSIQLYRTLFSSRLAIVLGSENKGVSSIWLNVAHKIITIPMFGDIDSLNVSNAMSIIIYEVLRQRNYD
ncbi:RNA methyltransferase [Blattabacterium cuenoti]|uniref:RNA methyltransferase n=1 Tax=Blattabacterium cuenoti TaxID=1653831 RepID=UPI00163C4981|nr:RNA methyltransferase [Blattabacterium cuenoti]